MEPGSHNGIGPGYTLETKRFLPRRVAAAANIVRRLYLNDPRRKSSKGSLLYVPYARRHLSGGECGSMWVDATRRGDTHRKAYLWETPILYWVQTFGYRKVLHSSLLHRKASRRVYRWIFKKAAEFRKRSGRACEKKKTLLFRNAFRQTCQILPVVTYIVWPNAELYHFDTAKRVFFLLMNMHANKPVNIRSTKSDFYHVLFFSLAAPRRAAPGP